MILADTELPQKNIQIIYTEHIQKTEEINIRFQFF